MNDVNAIKAWFDLVIGDDPNRTAAQKAGMDHTTLRTRREGIRTRAEDVIAVARAYNQPVVQALVHTRFLTPAEGCSGSNVSSNLAEASDQNLAEEILRRLQNGQAGPALTDSPENL